MEAGVKTVEADPKRNRGVTLDVIASLKDRLFHHLDVIIESSTLPDQIFLQIQGLKDKMHRGELCYDDYMGLLTGRTPLGGIPEKTNVNGYYGLRLDFNQRKVYLKA